MSLRSTGILFRTRATTRREEETYNSFERGSRLRFHRTQCPTCKQLRRPFDYSSTIKTPKVQ